MKEVFQGAREVFDIDLGVEDQCGSSKIVRPYDLTGFLSATSKICWAAGSQKIEKTFDDPNVSVIGAETAGMVQGILTDTETATLAADEVGAIEVVIDKGSGDVVRFQILDAFQVIPKICD